MKKFFCTVLIALAAFSTFAQTAAEAIITQIEQTKENLSYILANIEESDSSKRRQFRHELYTRYSELEKTVFNERLNNVSIEYYDMEAQGWKLRIKEDIYKNYRIADLSVILPYNVLSGKRFIPAAKMSDRQRTDYEYTVNTSDEELRNPENRLYAVLDYSIQRWDEASQYRFVPKKLSVFFIKDNTTSLLLETDDLYEFVKTFTLYPQIEVRNQTQITADKKRNADTLKAENEAKAERQEAASKTGVKQKGRRTFTVSIDSRMKDLTPSGFEFRNIELSTATGELTFGLGKFLFGGLSVGYDLDSINSTSMYEFGFSMGANVRLTSFFRPYLQMGAGLTTGNKLFAKAGAGLDFIMGHFLITTSYNYQLRYKWKSVLDSGITIPSEQKSYHTFSAGIGVSW